MSLVGFKARNHPQQTSRRGPNPAVDDRGTDPALFARLDERFHFTLDVAASAANAKCADYYTAELNGLQQPWSGRVWCNPPYSDIAPWVERAWHQWSRPSLELIVMLLPANRTEQGWWQEFIESERDRQRAHDVLRIEFLPGRPRFVAPGAEAIGPNERPPFGCCLAIWSVAS